MEMLECNLNPPDEGPYYYNCEVCGDEVYSEDSLYNAIEQEVCEGCADEELFRCDYCEEGKSGSIYHVYYTSGDYTYDDHICRDCYEFCLTEDEAYKTCITKIV